MRKNNMNKNASKWYTRSILLGIGACAILSTRIIPKHIVFATLIIAALLCVIIPSVIQLRAIEEIPTVIHRETVVELTAPLPKIGNIAPNFSLVDIDLSEVSLQDFAGMNKILNIVPSLDTPICALSAIKFNEEVGKLNNTVILNVSMDLPFANKRFCELEQIQNIRALSAFRAPHFGFTYGVRIKTGVLKGLLARSIILLDAENTVRYVELVPDIGNEPNYEKALAVLLEL